MKNRCRNKRPADDWFFRRRSPGNQNAQKAGLDQAKAASDESVPLSKRFRAGQNQIAMHERDLEAANDRVQETEQSIVVAQQSLELHRARVLEIKKSLQERRNHLEQLHRQAAAEASHGSEATPAANPGPRWRHQTLAPRGEGLSQESCRPLRGRTQSRGSSEGGSRTSDERKRWSLTSLEISTIGRTPCLTPVPRHESRRDTASSNQRRPREIGSLAGADGQRSQLAGSQEETEARVAPGEGAPLRSPLSRSMGTSGPRMQNGWRRWGRDTWCWGRSTALRRAGVTRKPPSSNGRAGDAASHRRSAMR